MSMEERNQQNDENKDKMKELAEALSVLLKKIEISRIQKERDEDYDYEEDYDDDDCDDDDMDFDENEYNTDLIIDLLYDVFETVQGNVPSCYTGADVTTGMLGLIALHNKSAVSVMTSLLTQLQMLQTQLMESDREKIELLKKQNELLEKILNK